MSKVAALFGNPNFDTHYVKTNSNNQFFYGTDLGTSTVHRIRKPAKNSVSCEIKFNKQLNK